MPNLKALTETDFLFNTNGRKAFNTVGFAPETLNRYREAIQGLTLDQARAALAAKGLNIEQRDQVLVHAGLITSSNQLNAQTVQQTLTSKGLAAEDQKRILLKLGLMDGETNQIITTKQLTKAEYEELVANKLSTQADREAALAALTGTGANQSYMVSFKLLAASIWESVKALGKFLVTNPVGWAILAATGIFAAVKAYDALTVSVEEAREKAGESISSGNIKGSLFQ